MGMVINGVSTRKVRAVVEELRGTEFSKSTVSEFCIGKNMLNQKKPTKRSNRQHNKCPIKKIESYQRDFTHVIELDPCCCLNENSF